MSSRVARMEVRVGTRLIGSEGYLLVTELGRHTATVETSEGTRRAIPLGELAGIRVVDGAAEVGVGPLEPWWSSLPAEVRRIALNRLEVVLEIECGYRWGHRRLAQAGEPFPPFGDLSVTLAERCRRMAAQLTYEQQADRLAVRRVHDGEIVSASVSPRTVRYWVTAWHNEGLRGLVDKRSTREKQGFDALPAPVREIVEEVMARFDGDTSRVNTKTIEAQVRRRLRNAGHGDLQIPERLFKEYLSHAQRALGRSTRAHKSNRHRTRASAHTTFAALHPAHLALDATRVDNLVWDEVDHRPRSVEVLTLISVATRVVVALRVTPRSGNALEAGLVLYDAMRPMSMLVDGTTIDDWRWCGLPESIDLSEVPVHRSARRVVPPGRTLEGVHYKPGVKAASIRSDHGSIFLADHFVGLLRDFGIDLMLSRGSKPTDNAFVERWHETLQRAYQEIPGFKGRNVSERGRRVEHTGEALLTAAELERRLRQFVALDYHRAWHEGLVLPGAPEARLTPLEMWDAMMAATGRIDVPQQPDLIYQFLPLRWLTIGHAGVEYKNLTYDAPVLTDFRNVREGTFRAGDRTAPFHYDPRDVSRLWFRHPETNRIHEIPWKANYLRDVPLNDWIRDRALANISARGGNKALKRDSSWLAIIDEIGQLTSPQDTAEARAQVYASTLRWERAQRDHLEVEEASDAAQVASGTGDLPRRAVRELAAVNAVDEDEDWPDYREMGF